MTNIIQCGKLKASMWEDGSATIDNGSGGMCVNVDELKRLVKMMSSVCGGSYNDKDYINGRVNID